MVTFLRQSEPANVKWRVNQVHRENIAVESVRKCCDTDWTFVIAIEILRRAWCTEEIILTKIFSLHTIFSVAVYFSTCVKYTYYRESSGLQAFVMIFPTSSLSDIDIKEVMKTWFDVLTFAGR